MQSNRSILFKLPLILFLLTASLLVAQVAFCEGEPFSRVTPVVRAVKMAGPAVVNISSVQVSRTSPFSSLHDDFFNRFFRDFFDSFEGYSRNTTSLGSGVVIDGEKGYILTNHHVVTRSSEIRVQLVDDREFVARVVGTDPDSDLAVLQIDTGEKLPALRMGDSSDLMIGETVIAIGNPFGLTHTVTTGVISSLNRTIRAQKRFFKDFIQTDASINPGNSGGPLLNINGELIGINAAIYDQAEGIGFAIPINKARRIIRDLISYGQVQPVWLGLSMQNLDEELIRHFGLNLQNGVLISDVKKGSPAEKAGLRRGDILLSINRNRIGSIAEYEDVLRGFTHGSPMTLSVMRAGKNFEVNATAEIFPANDAGEIGWNRYGLQVANAGKDRRFALVEKVRLNSPAYEIGLRRGDLIHRINELDISSREDFITAMIRYRFREGISMVVQRENQVYRITLRP